MLLISEKIEEIKEDKSIIELSIVSRNTAISEGYASDNDPLGCIARKDENIIIIGRDRPNTLAPISAFILSCKIMIRNFNLENSNKPIIMVINRRYFKTQTEFDNFLSTMAAEFIDFNAKLYLYGDSIDEDEYFD